MSNSSNLINNIMYFIRQYWKYKFRDLGMTFSSIVFSSGVTILLYGGVWKLLIAFEVFNIPSSISFNANDYSGFGIILIIFGLAIGIVRLIDLGKQLTGILIVHRGMEGMETSAIKNVLPKSLLKGKLEIIDLHEGHQIHQGKVIHPERALEVINHLDQQIKTRLNGRLISEVNLAYGGLAPIPLMVAAGFKVTSRQNCIILDYSRVGSWHGLDNIDDQEEITVSGPKEAIDENVAIIMPFSLSIADSQLPDVLSKKSYSMSLRDGARPDSLNSTDKQNRVANEFYKLCANMKATHPNVKEIHVFIASQASFAFRLGTMLTTSVMPKISIYQYDSSLGEYSWGVTITSGINPTITNSKNI